jgi:hypothetical protein
VVNQVNRHRCATVIISKDQNKLRAASRMGAVCRQGVEAVRIASILVLTFAMCMALGPDAQARDLTAAEKAVISDAVLEDLGHPPGAEFKWPPLIDPTGLNYCGWVNPQNAQGGHDGFRSFGAVLFRQDGKVAWVAITGLVGGNFPKVILDVCTKSYGSPL